MPPETEADGDRGARRLSRHTLAEVIVNTGFEFDRPPDVPVTPAPSAETLGAASERALIWRIDRAVKEGFDVTLPSTPGRYVVSVLKVSEDGDVGAATLALEVR